MGRATPSIAAGGRALGGYKVRQTRQSFLDHVKGLPIIWSVHSLCTVVAEPPSVLKVMQWNQFPRPVVRKHDLLQSISRCPILKRALQIIIGKRNVDRTAVCAIASGMMCCQRSLHHGSHSGEFPSMKSRSCEPRSRPRSIRAALNSKNRLPIAMPVL